MDSAQVPIYNPQGAGYMQPPGQGGYPQQPYHYGAAQDDPFVRYVKWGLIGLVTVTGVGAGIYFLTRRSVSRHEEKKTLDKDSPASFAKNLVMAFENNGWYGADMVRVRQVIREIPDVAFKKKVEASYNRLTGNILGDDLKEYLHTSEYQEVKAMLDALPEKAGSTPQKIYDPYGWARRLNAGVTHEAMGLFWGTDEDAINLVLKDVPTQKAWEDVKQAYEELYPGYALMSDLEGDGFSEEYVDSIIKKKPYA